MRVTPLTFSLIVLAGASLGIGGARAFGSVAPVTVPLGCFNLGSGYERSRRIDRDKGNRGIEL